MLTTTSTLLLEALTDPANHAAWVEFDARYRPVITRFAGRFGMNATDAEDAAQVTLTRFAVEYRAGKYHRDRGRLRSWIFAMARYCIADARSRTARDQGRRGESALASVPAPAESELSEWWEAEWRGEVLRRAFDELRTSRADAETVTVLEALVLEGKTANEVARERGISLNAVYIAKHRALERVRTILERLEQDF